MSTGAGVVVSLSTGRGSMSTGRGVYFHREEGCVRI